MFHTHHNVRRIDDSEDVDRLRAPVHRGRAVEKKTVAELTRGVAAPATNASRPSNDASVERVDGERDGVSNPAQSAR